MGLNGFRNLDYFVSLLTDLIFFKIIALFRIINNNKPSCIANFAMQGQTSLKVFVAIFHRKYPYVKKIVLRIKAL